MIRSAIILLIFISVLSYIFLMEGRITKLQRGSENLFYEKVLYV